MLENSTAFEQNMENELAWENAQTYCNGSKVIPGSLIISQQESRFKSQAQKLSEKLHEDLEIHEHLLNIQIYFGSSVALCLHVILFVSYFQSLLN